MARHNELGRWGENVAREHLLVQGYSIAEANVRVGSYEIDLIATKDDRIVFVEVKTRSDDFEDPLLAVDRRRQARLCRAADSYIRSRNIRLDPQFDIITVIGTPDTGCRVEHFADAFFPPLNSY